MIELFTLFLLFGALLHRTGIGLPTIGIISALMSAFFFIYFLSRKAAVYGAIIGAMMLLGAVTAGVHEVNTGQDFFISRTINGAIQSVDRRLDKTMLIVKDQQYKKLIQATIHTKNDFLPGDIVAVGGAIDRPTDFLTDTGRIFPYQQYLLSKDIVAIMPLASATLVSFGTWSLSRFATMLRFDIAAILSKYISFPIDGLVSGMLVGYQGGYPMA